MRALKVLGGIISVLLGLPLLALIILEFSDWNAFRDVIARQSKQRLGREIRIAGDLEIKVLRRCPTVSADDIRFENASWGSDAQMFHAGHAGASICLWPLLRGQVHFASIELRESRILAERNSAGRWNFELHSLNPIRKEAPEIGPKDAVWKSDAPLRLPVWERVQIDGVELVVKLPRGKATDLVFRIDTLRSERKRDELPIVVNGKGMIQKLPWDLDASIQTDGVGLTYDMKLHVAELAVESTGKVGDIDTLDAVTGDVTIDAKNIDELASVLGTKLSGKTPHVRLKTGFASEGRTIRVGTLDLVAGATNVGGWLAVDMTERISIRGVLNAPKVHVKELATFAPKAKEAAVNDKNPKHKGVSGEAVDESRLISSAKIATDVLRAVDVDLQFAIGSLEGDELLKLIDNVDAKVVLDEGRLQLHPARIGFSNGTIETKIFVNASTADSLSTNIDIAMRGIDLQRALKPFLPDFKFANTDEGEILTGKLTGSVKLASGGVSARELATGLDGSVDFEVADGRISAALIEAAGFDLTELIGTLSSDKATLKMDCMISAWDLKGGVAETKAVAIGTTDSNIIAKGTVNFGTEAIDLEVTTLAKDFSVGSLKAPIDIEGTFAEPRVKPRAVRLLAKVAAAVGLGIAAGPAAALVPLIETGGEKTGRCSDYRVRVAELRKDAKAVSH